MGRKVRCISAPCCDLRHTRLSSCPEILAHIAFPQLDPRWSLFESARISMDEGKHPLADGDRATPLSSCLRQDAQSYLRQISRLEQELKAERENGRQLVLSHHSELEVLRRQNEELEEKLRQERNQRERHREAYNQLMCAHDICRNDAETQRKEAEEKISSHIEKMQQKEDYFRKKLSDEKKIISELREKLEYHGSTQNPTDEQLHWAVSEELKRAQESLHTHTMKWVAELKTLKTSLNEAKETVDVKDKLIATLRDELSEISSRNKHAADSNAKRLVLQFNQLVQKHAEMIQDAEFRQRAMLLSTHSASWQHLRSQFHSTLPMNEL